MIKKIKKLLNSIIKFIYSILTKLDKKEINNEVLDTLADERTKVQNLDGKIIAKWFREKSEGKSDQLKMVLSYIDTDLLIRYGFSINEDIKIRNILLQFLYDEKTSKMIESRLIRFENIDTNLQAQLEENSGLLVFLK